MEKLFKTDYVVYDKINDHVLQDSMGHIIIFGNKDEAIADCYANEIAIPCIELPTHWQNELVKQIEIILTF